MSISKWKKIAKRISENRITKAQFIDHDLYYDFLGDVAEKIQKYSYYTYDGRFEDTLIDTIFDEFSKPLEHIDLEKIAKMVSDKLKGNIVPNIILIPMNHLNVIYLENDLKLDDNMTIFSMKEKLADIKKDKSKLARYVEKKIFCKFGANHILVTKDPYFFNYPVLAISLEHIDYRVEHEAPVIVESAYSLLRILDLNIPREPLDKGWGVKYRDKKPEAFTYTVYYKEARSNYEDLNDGELGYSFRYKFSPILDINTQQFIEYKDNYTNLLNRVIEYSFIPEIDYKHNDFTIRKKWLNGIMLFNTAYEFISIGKFDAALLIMITILESFFFKLGDNNNSATLSSRLYDFLNPNDFDIDVKSLIRDVYKYRNNFVHQGIGLERFKSYRSLHDREGFILGQKPFVHDAIRAMPEMEYKNYRTLMDLVIHVLTNDVDRLIDYYKIKIEA